MKINFIHPKHCSITRSLGKVKLLNLKDLNNYRFNKATFPITYSVRYIINVINGAIRLSEYEN